jgi:Tol biopolymer transport system component
LRRIVRRCLRKEAGLRYDSLRDTALDLREPISEIEPPTRKRKRFAIAAAILLIAIAVVAGWFLTHRHVQPKPEHRGMMMTRLTHSGRVTTAAISPDGKYLVHAVREGDSQALYVKQIATGTVTKIADAAPLSYFNLRISPDGNYAYYVAATNAEPNAGHIYQLPLLGGTPRRIAEDTEFWYSLSPDGTRVVFRRLSALTRESTITIAAVDGRGEQIVLRRKEPLLLQLPAWKHDGSTITFVEGNLRTRDLALHELDLATSKITPIDAVPQFPGVDAYAWLPDGSGALVTVYEREQPPQIWYVPIGDTTGRKVTSEVSAYSGVTPTADSSSFSAVRDSSDSNIYLLHLDTKPQSQRALTSGFGNWVGAAGVRWLNDREVAFSSPANGFNAFFVVDIDGGAPRRFIENMSMTNLIVSPDRSRVAFVSNKSGSVEIWIADATGENARQLTHQGIAGWPAFTADSRSIIYLGAEGQQAWRIAVDGKTAPVLVTRVPMNRPTVSPDGQWLLCRLRSTTPGTALWRTAILLRCPARRRAADDAVASERPRVPLRRHHRRRREHLAAGARRPRAATAHVLRLGRHLLVRSRAGWATHRDHARAVDARRGVDPRLQVAVAVVASASTCTSRMRTVPTRMSSPGAISIASITRRVPTNVPFLLPRSSSVTVAPVMTMRAWRRDTSGAWRTIASCGSRPMMFSPARSGISSLPRMIENRARSSDTPAAANA